MRTLAGLLVMVACKSAPPAPPEAAAFAKSAPDEQCAATASRAIRCSDELSVAAARQLGLTVAGDQPATEREARGVHRAACLGDEAYAQRIVSCWAIAACDAFAACVYPPKAK